VGNGKIFGIGLSKTGTTSLANALTLLRYKTRDNLGASKYAAGDLSSIDLEIVNAHEALTDTPIPSFYRELDAAYPGSKFILTVRDSNGWLASCRKQFTQRGAEQQTEAHKRLFIDLYGSDVFNEEGFVRGYRSYVEGVRQYFRNRPDDLLIIDITAGEGWGKLCRFLGRPVPDIPFPKANVTQVRWMTIDEVAAVATEAGAELIRHYPGEPPLGVVDQRGQPAGAAVKRFFERAARTIRGRDAVPSAVRATNKTIIRGLASLNASIPVLTRVATPSPYEVRRGWNHFWLVDPLDGESAFGDGSAEFSINIALIEDGHPLYGVVYAPSSGTLYCGVTGKRAYKRSTGGAVLPFPGDKGNTASRLTTGDNAMPVTDERKEGSSRALALCRFSEALQKVDATFRPSMEWHTAAAHPLLFAAGLSLHDSKSGKELGYNKKDLANGAVRIVPRSVASSAE
jgi:3'-phosphoadenosine 5'-phosphosulfate (PAPS) 3'-phosphatase